MQNGPSRWKLKPPPWAALGENESLWGGCAGSDPGHQQTRQCEIHFERWAADEATQQRQKKKKSSLLTWFKISFQPFSHFALPPTQLHGSSHNFIQLVAVSFHKKILLYYNIILNDLIVSAENQKYCLMYVPHLTPLSLNVHHSTGSHLTHACWVCYHSYNTIPTPPPFSQTIICRLFPPIGSHGWRCSMK